MNQQRRQLRVIFSLIGLVCVCASIAMIFLAPGTFWNWGLLAVALGFVFLARRSA